MDIDENDEEGNLEDTSDQEENLHVSVANNMEGITQAQANVSQTGINSMILNFAQNLQASKRVPVVSDEPEFSPRQ